MSQIETSQIQEKVEIVEIDLDDLYVNFKFYTTDVLHSLYEKKDELSDEYERLVFIDLPTDCPYPYPQYISCIMIHDILNENEELKEKIRNDYYECYRELFNKLDDIPGDVDIAKCIAMKNDFDKIIMLYEYDTAIVLLKSRGE